MVAKVCKMSRRGESSSCLHAQSIVYVFVFHISYLWIKIIEEHLWIIWTIFSTKNLWGMIHISPKWHNIIGLRSYYVVCLIMVFVCSGINKFWIKAHKSMDHPTLLMMYWVFSLNRRHALKLNTRSRKKGSSH